MEVRAQAPFPGEAEKAALAKELQHSIKTHVGTSTKVNVLGPETIERTAVGKAKRVIDKRLKD